MGYKRTLLLNLYNLALSDNLLHAEEMRYIYDKSTEYGVSSSELDELLLNPHKVKFKMPETFKDVFEMSFAFAEIILADDIVDPRELKLFRELMKQVKYIEVELDKVIEYLLDSIRLGISKDECELEFKRLINKL